MANVNKVILIGNLGSDPEKRVTGSGQTVATFNIATNERWTDKSGQKQEKTEWHRIVVWGPQAESCAQYLAKGRQVYIEGRLQTRQWEDKEGNKRYTTEIVAQRVQFLGGPPAAAKNGQPAAIEAPAPDATPADLDMGMGTPGNSDVPF